LALLIFRMDFSNEHFLLLLGILGALAGFLYYNWNPSKMFMGDTGSQFLGVFLAVMGIVFFWNSSDSNGYTHISEQFIVSMLAFALPIIDTTTVVIKRISRGASPFIGGKDHTTHHLSYIGIKERHIALLFAATYLINGIYIVWVLIFVEEWTISTLLPGIFLFIAEFFTLFIIALKPKKEVSKPISTKNEK